MDLAGGRALRIMREYAEAANCRRSSFPVDAVVAFSLRGQFAVSPTGSMHPSDGMILPMSGRSSYRADPCGDDDSRRSTVLHGPLASMPPAADRGRPFDFAARLAAAQGTRRATLAKKLISVGLSGRRARRQPCAGCGANQAGVARRCSPMFSTWRRAVRCS